MVSELRCIECNGLLQMKKNRKTNQEFWGCTRWPDCEFTESRKNHDDRYAREIIGDYDISDDDWYLDPWGMFYD